MIWTKQQHSKHHSLNSWDNKLIWPVYSHGHSCHTTQYFHNHKFTQSSLKTVFKGKLVLVYYAYISVALVGFFLKGLGNYPGPFYSLLLLLINVNKDKVDKWFSGHTVAENCLLVAEEFQIEFWDYHNHMLTTEPLFLCGRKLLFLSLMFYYVLWIVVFMLCPSPNKN